MTEPSAIRTYAAASGAVQELVARTMQNGTMIIPTKPMSTGGTVRRFRTLVCVVMRGVSHVADWLTRSDIREFSNVLAVIGQHRVAT